MRILIVVLALASFASAQVKVQGAVKLQGAVTFKGLNPTLDIYGGLASQTCAGGAAAHFYTELIRGEWRFCTPAGHSFFYQAVYVIDTDSRQTTMLTTKYGDADLTWGPQQLRRLKSWGFNASGPYSKSWVLPWTTHPNWPGDHTQPVKVPAIAQARIAYYGECNINSYTSAPFKEWIINGTDTHYTNYHGGGFPDIYDPLYTSYMNGYLNDSAQTGGWTSAYTIGINIDDTDQLQGFGCGPDFGNSCGGGEVNPHLGWTALITKPSQSSGHPAYGCTATYSDTKVYTKYALRDWLKTQHAGADDAAKLAALNTAWGSSYTTWDSAGGWGVGTGLLDENGRNAWVCADNGTLSGCTVGMKTDLDGFQYQIARTYFTTNKSILTSHFPGILYLGPSVIGSWHTPGYRNVLSATQGQLDVLPTDWTGGQTQLDWNILYAGDVPMIAWLGQTANPDSEMSAFFHDGIQTTQADRGQYFYDSILNMLTGISVNTGHKPIAGYQFWQWYDNITESANWGLVSVNHDNPYDGTYDKTAPPATECYNSICFPTTAEPANYGDAITKVKAANALWMSQ